MTKAVHVKIKGIQAQIRKTNKDMKNAKEEITRLRASIQKIEGEIKNLAGPMSQGIRSALRALGIELTIYWSGTFVGPQISKLMPKDSFLHFFAEIEASFVRMQSKLTLEEITQGQHLLMDMKRLFGAFFILLHLLKHTHKVTLSDASDIEQAIIAYLYSLITKLFYLCP